MAALRKFLMYSSVLIALAIFIFWLILHRNFDILPFGMIILFFANAFYLYYSVPTISTSDILEHASSKLTLASLELRYLSQEAQLREVEAEKLRLANIEREKYKLQVAKDLLEHLQLKLPPRRSPGANTQKIPQQTRVGIEAIALPAVALTDASDGADATSRAIAKQAQTGLPPAMSTFN